MAKGELKLAKWQIATVSIIVLIIPFIIVYQLTKPDITIDTSLPFGITDRFSSACDEGILCMYNMNSITKEITITEDEESWTMNGNCVDTSGKSLARFNAVLQRDSDSPASHADPSDDFNANKCLDSATFLKKDWDRENRIFEYEKQVQCITFPCYPITQNLEFNIFTLKNVADEEDVMDFIENYKGE